jgi:hypothetical protein
VLGSRRLLLPRFSVDKNGMAARRLAGTVPANKFELKSTYLQASHRTEDIASQHNASGTVQHTVKLPEQHSITNVMSRNASHSGGIVPERVFSERDSDLFTNSHRKQRGVGFQSAMSLELQGRHAHVREVRFRRPGFSVPFNRLEERFRALYANPTPDKNARSQTPAWGQNLKNSQ